MMIELSITPSYDLSLKRSITDRKGLDVTSGKPFWSCCVVAQAVAPWCHI